MPMADPRNPDQAFGGRGYFTKEELEKMGAPIDHAVLVSPNGTRTPLTETRVDYNDHESMIRRWAIEQVMSRGFATNVEEVVDAAKTIEAYVKGEK